MRVDYSCYSELENRRARERLRLIMKDREVWKAARKPIFWTLPFLLRMWKKVDELGQTEPRFALELAERAAVVAERIPLRSPSEFYASEEERRDFVAVSLAIHSSTLIQTGQPEMARKISNQALGMVSSSTRDPRARAEVLRRAAHLATETGELTAVPTLATPAIEIFFSLKEYDSLALCHLHLGQALYLLDQHGDGIDHYARALYWGARSGHSGRGHRAVVAAAGNLAYCALRDRDFSADAAQWARAARDAMKGQPTSIPKLRIEWIVALAAFREGLGRYAATRLASVRDRLLKLDAFGDAAACTADLITVVRNYEPEVLEKTVQDCVEVLREATPEQARSLVETWIRNPLDVAILRQLGLQKASSRTD